jgi:hypothetical protein
MPNQEDWVSENGFVSKGTKFKVLYLIGDAMEDETYLKTLNQIGVVLRDHHIQVTGSRLSVRLGFPQLGITSPMIFYFPSEISLYKEPDWWEIWL